MNLPPWEDCSCHSCMGTIDDGDWDDRPPFPSGLWMNPAKVKYLETLVPRREPSKEVVRTTKREDDWWEMEERLPMTARYLQSA